MNGCFEQVVIPHSSPKSCAGHCRPKRFIRPLANWYCTRSFSGLRSSIPQLVEAAHQDSLTREFYLLGMNCDIPQTIQDPSMLLVPLALWQLAPAISAYQTRRELYESTPQEYVIFTET